MILVSRRQERNGRLLCVAFLGVTPMSALAPPSPAPKLGSLVRVTVGSIAGLTGRLLEFPESGRCLIDVPSSAHGVYLRIELDLLEFATEEQRGPTEVTATEVTAEQISAVDHAGPAG
jgi:hypothetical protein